LDTKLITLDTKLVTLDTKLVTLPLFPFTGQILEHNNVLYIQEEIKSRLKLGNASYHPVQNLLSSSLLSKNLKIKIYRTRPPLWSSGQSFWLLTQRSRVRFPALPDFLSGSGSGTGSTQPREVN
jgi:hypothetical protein